jgi:hypothetical protein
VHFVWRPIQNARRLAFCMGKWESVRTRAKKSTIATVTGEPLRCLAPMAEELVGGAAAAAVVAATVTFQMLSLREPLAARRDL